MQDSTSRQLATVLASTSLALSMTSGPTGPWARLCVCRGEWGEDSETAQTTVVKPIVSFSPAPNGLQIKPTTKAGASTFMSTPVPAGCFSPSAQLCSAASYILMYCSMHGLLNVEGTIEECAAACKQRLGNILLHETVSLSRRQELMKLQPAGEIVWPEAPPSRAKQGSR